MLREKWIVGEIVGEIPGRCGSWIMELRSMSKDKIMLKVHGWEVERGVEQRGETL